MIIDCAVYHQGERVHSTSSHTDLAAAVAMTKEPSDFVWIGLRSPSAEEFGALGEAFDLHPLAVEDAVKSHQRPKIEKYSDHVFFVLKTLSYEDETDSVETGEINAFLGRNYLITVRHGDGPSLDSIRRRAETQPKVLALGPAAALHAIVDSVVDRYVEVVSDLHVDVSEVEESVFSEGRSKDASRIYGLKREVLETRRAVEPLIDPLHRIVAGQVAYLGAEALPFYRDISDHVTRVAESVDSLDSLLDNALNAHLANLSIQQNDDMRKLAAYAAMFAAPTLIAGVYGMNFDHMPELRLEYGYYLCLGAMILVVLFLYRAFKRSGWL